jgi:curved DNA-binding protein CbpA
MANPWGKRRKDTSLEGLIRLIAEERSVHELLNRIVEERSYLRLCRQVYSQADDPRFQAELARIGRPYGLEAETIRHRITPILQALHLVEETEGPWSVLGLSPGAGLPEIKKAYRRLSLRYHPDHNRDDPEAEEHFLKIRLAYEMALREPSGKAVEPSLGWLEDRPGKNARKRRRISPSFLWQVGLAVVLLLLTSLVMDWLYPTMVFKEHETFQQGRELVSGKTAPPDSPSPADQSMNISHAPKEITVTELRRLPESTMDLSEKKQTFSSVREIAKEDKEPVKENKEITKENKEKEKVSFSLATTQESPRKKSVLLAQGHAEKAEKESQPPLPPKSESPEQFPRKEETFRNLEARLKAFLAAYTSAYRNRDLAAFGNFFTEDAEENGTPIKELFPIYAQDFMKVTIREYSILLQSWQDTGGSVLLKGRFVLSLLWSDGRSGNYQGAISLRLRSYHDAFKVERLDYTYQ